MGRDGWSWAALTGDGADRTVTVWRRVTAPPRVVWAALTQVADVSAWFGTVTVPGGSAPTVGSSVRVAVSEEGDSPVVFEARVSQCEPPHQLCLEWAWDEVVTSTVTLRLRPDGTGTTIRLSDTGLPAEAVAEFGDAWDGVLAGLAEYVDGADVAEADEDFWSDLQHGEAVAEHTMPVSPDAVWAAWSTADGLSRWWWPHDVSAARFIDPSPAGTFRLMSSAAGVSVTGEIIDVRPGEGMSMTWLRTDTTGAGPDEAVDLTLVEEPGGTRVRVVHTGPWRHGEEAGVQTWWQNQLGRLASVWR